MSERKPRATKEEALTAKISKCDDEILKFTQKIKAVEAQKEAYKKELADFRDEKKKLARKEELKRQREEQKRKKMEFLEKLAKSGIDFDKASEMLGL